MYLLRRRSSHIEKITVIVPCFNEEANIARLEAELPPALAKSFESFKIIAVDDGSTDQTMAELHQWSLKNSNVMLIRHPFNQGLGAAVRTGLAAARADLVLTLDADLTFHPDQIPVLLEALPGADAVFGSPVLGEMKDVSWGRRILSRGVNLIYGFLLGNRLTSVSSLFRLYRREALAGLGLRSQSFDINAEIASKLSVNGAVIKEVPVVLTARVNGASKIRFAREIANHLRMFGKIILWRMKGSSRKS